MRSLPFEHLYFVETALVSVIAELEDGRSAEVWFVGREGIVGVPALLGASSSPFKRVVSIPGTAQRIAARDLKLAMERSPLLREILFRYSYAVMVQVAQVSVCSRLHPLPMRLSRWLLTASHAMGRAHLPLTHDMLARSMGVRRASVSTILGEFEQAGLIAATRGGVTLRDVPGLTEASCKCHRVMLSALQRALTLSSAGPETPGTGDLLPAFD